MEGKRRLKRYFAWLLVLSLAFTMSFSNLAFATEGDPVESETPAVTQDTGTEGQPSEGAGGSDLSNEEGQLSEDEDAIIGDDEDDEESPVEYSSPVTNEETGVGYETIEAAIAALGEDEENLVVSQDIELSDTIEITRDVTLNLVNESQIKGVDCRAFHVKKGILYVLGKGNISSECVDKTKGFDYNSSVIRVGDNGDKDGTEAGFTIEDGVSVTSEYCYGVTVFGSKTTEFVTINGAVVVTGSVPALSGNGTAGYGDTEITVNGYVGAANDNAIYHPQTGTLVINGFVEGGIEAKSGTVTINKDAYVYSKDLPEGENPSHNPYSDGCSTSGYAIALVENSAYVGSPKLIVKGGEISGEIGIESDDTVTEEKKASVTITGGTFSTDVSAYIDKESYKCVEDDGWYDVVPIVVASVGGKTYPTLQKAVDAAAEGAKVTLKDNIELSKLVKINKDLEIDLNGHNISIIDNYALWNQKGTLELSGKGTISSTTKKEEPNDSCSVVFLGGYSSTDVANLKVGNDVTIVSDYCYGVSVFGSQDNEKITSIEINGTVGVTGEAPALSGNGSLDNDKKPLYGGTNITVNGTVSAENDNAIYQPQAGELTINGNVEGGIEAKAGTVTINDNAVVKKNPAKAVHTANGNGCSTLGYAVALVENSAYAGSPKLVVKGGEISGEIVIEADDTVDEDKKASITIMGGTFTNDVEAYIDKLEYRCTKLAEDKYQVTAKAVAIVDEVSYRTLQAAVDAAKEGSTVAINENIEITEPVEVDKSLTFDMGGNSIKAADCRAFHIKKGTVKFTGKGTVSADKSGTTSTFDSSLSVIRVGDNNVDANSEAKLTIDKNVKVTSNHCYGITVFGKNTKETVVIDGTVDVTGEAPALSGNGSLDSEKKPLYGGTDITVNGTVSAKNDNAIYHPQAGTLTVNGTVEGGIEAKAGTVTINDTAVVKRNSAELMHDADSNGCSTLGYGIALVEHKSYAGKATLNVNGGKISGKVDILQDNVVEDGNEAKIKISGGYFTELGNDFELNSGLALVTSNLKDYVYMVDNKKPSVVDLIPVAGGVVADTEDEALETIIKGITFDENILDAALRTEANNLEIKAEEIAGADKVYIKSYLKVNEVEYNAKKTVCVLDITPIYEVVATYDGKDDVVVATGEISITKPITITMPAPFDIGDKEQITVKHTKDNGDLYYYPAAVTKQTEGKMISFVVTNGFSEFTFMVNSDDARIGDISLGEGIEVKKAEGSDFVYEANVEPNVGSVSLKVAGTDEKADVRVLVGGSEFKDESLKLQTGLNEAFILVIAENDTCNLYTLKINKRAVADNADLAGIELSDGSLSPAFAAEKTGYTVSVNNAVEAITVVPEVAESHAKVTVNGEADKAEVALSEGRNAVEIKVTAENGTEKVYKLNVMRLAKVGATYKYGSLNYKVKTAANGTGTVEVAGYSGNTMTNVKVPDTIKISDISYKVTAVGYRAFYGKTKLKYVTIGNNVSTIGISAFAKCTALKKATLGTGITSIGNYAFSNDTKLTTIIIKSGKLKTVGKGALNKVKKVKVKVPKAKVKAYKKLFKGKKAKKYTVVKL